MVRKISTAAMDGSGLLKAQTGRGQGRRRQRWKTACRGRRKMSAVRGQPADSPWKAL